MDPLTPQTAGAPPPSIPAPALAGPPPPPPPGLPSLRPVPGMKPQTDGERLYTLLSQTDPQSIARSDAQLRDIIKRTRDASLEGRELLERGWWQKLLYINGRQWIYYTPRGGWQDKRLARWIPRPVVSLPLPAEVPTTISMA